MNNIVFNKGTPILLYGAAARGGGFFRRLTQKGHAVSGFIDRRADEILEHCGVRVFGMRSGESDGRPL